MKKTAKKNRAKRVIASVLAGVMMLSTASALTVTANAASYSASVNVKSEITDGFFSGASTLISVITKSHPVAGIITSGLFGAFKTFYNDATKIPQPTNQDIVNLLNELSEKIDDHFNDQSSQVKALENIEKLQKFSNILLSVKGYNETAMGQIALYKEDSVCAQDYQNIMDCTIDNNDFTKDFLDLSNLIIDGQAGVKGLPSFKQYLEFSKATESNNNDAVLVKKDCDTFNKMTIEQYALYFTNLMTGCLAKYNLAELNCKEGRIDEKTMNSIKSSVEQNMNIYVKKAAAVAKQYTETQNTVKGLTVAKVNAGGKTTEMFSFGDAWVSAVKQNGTMQLVKDWKSSNLAGDVFYYKANGEFKNGALYANGKTVTLDLAGHNIINSGNTKYDIVADNATLTLKDSTATRAAVNGILANGGKVTLDGVTIKDSTDAGIRADHLTMNISNSTFSGNKNSAIVTEKNATTTVNNCVFKTNYNSAVYNKESTVEIKGSYFENNRSDGGDGTTKNGGAIYTHSRMTVDGCEFAYNKANKGGAFFGDYTSSIKNCTFTGNVSADNGGAVCFDYRGSGWCAPLDITGTKFHSNRAGKNGGAVYCDSMNYLTLKDVEMKYNQAGLDGGGLYAQKGSSSSCDPTISGKITIVDNYRSNGNKSNAFLGENSTSKCIFKITDNIDPNSRIGITSNTSDGDLDVVKIWNKSAYNNTANVFSYDTSKYRINRYTHWYSDFYWVEIVKR